MSVEKNAVATQQPQQTELTPGAQFSTYAIKEFASQVGGESHLSTYQTQLMQGYFIGIDRALKIAEENRIRKNEANTNKQYNNDLAINWNTVNLKECILDAVHYAKMGLDMMQPNHLTAMPFKNKKTNQYDVTFIKGYSGIQYIAEKYALNKPKNVITELVYSTDIFKPVKKSAVNEVESYEFEITNPFNRGTVIGGFGYLQYDDSKKNRLIIMTLKDIEKRKPKYAAADFWGGTKSEYVNGKKQDVETEGWYEEMCMKTLIRYVYSPKHIEIDPMKIDESYQYMREAETRYVQMETQAMIEEQANTEEFVMPDPEPETPKEQPKSKKTTIIDEINQSVFE
jgi:recombination protein RecT